MDGERMNTIDELINFLHEKHPSVMVEFSHYIWRLKEEEE